MIRNILNNLLRDKKKNWQNNNLIIVYVFLKRLTHLLKNKKNEDINGILMIN